MPTLPRPSPQLPGFELRDEIGEGGFARVYRARRLEDGRDVAVKVLRERQRMSPQAVARFLREARALAKIDHPNVVRVFDVIEVPDHLAISMELINGRSLKSELESHGALGAEEVARTGIALSRALCAVHNAGFVHRDVKLENVMRDDDGRVVLMDFGLAREVDPESRLTTIGTIIGTPIAMAPEQFAGADVDARSDIWALGCLLYRLAADRPAYGGKTIEEIRHKVIRGQHKPIRLIRSDFPPDLERVIEHAMAVRSRNRPAEAAAFEAELRRCSGPLGVVVDDDSESSAHADVCEPTPRRTLFLTVLALVVLVTILGVIIYLSV